MLELKIMLDGIDYDTLMPTLIPLMIKNPIAAKAALAAYKLKTCNMSPTEKDALAAKLLTDNKGQVITKLNGKLSAKGIIGQIVDFDAKSLQ